jgi:hypothetical protein
MLVPQVLVVLAMELSGLPGINPILVDPHGFGQETATVNPGIMLLEICPLVPNGSRHKLEDPVGINHKTVDLNGIRHKLVDPAGFEVAQVDPGNQV